MCPHSGTSTSCRAGNVRGHLAMPLRGRPAVLLAAQHQRRAANARQQGAGIRACQQRANLRGENLGAAAHEHVDDGRDQRGLVQPRPPDHALHPARGHLRHAAFAGDLQQFMTAGGFAFAGFACRQRLHPGVEQCKCRRGAPAHAARLRARRVRPWNGRRGRIVAVLRAAPSRPSRRANRASRTSATVTAVRVPQSVAGMSPDGWRRRPGPAAG